MKVLTTALFASGASAANLVVAHFSGAVLSLEFTGQNELRHTGKVTGDISMPAWMTLVDSTDGTRKLYVSDESNEASFGVAVTYDVDAYGQLYNSVITSVPGGVVYTTPYGNGFFAATRYTAGSIFTQKLPLTPTSPVLQSFNYTMSAPGPNVNRQLSPHPHSIFRDPTGRFLISLDLGADLLRIFRVNPTTGVLTECPAIPTFPGAGPRHGSWWTPTPAGCAPGPVNASAAALFILNELNNSVTRYGFNYGAHGKGCLDLTAEQTIATYPEGTVGKDGSKAAEIQVVDNFMYVSNRYDETFGADTDSVAHFAINSRTGLLEFVELTSAYGSCPRTFEVHPEGHLVAIAGQTTSNLAIVERNQTTGKLGDLLTNLDILIPGRRDTETGLGAVSWV